MCRSLFLREATAYRLKQIHSISNFTSLVTFQQAVPVLKPGYANKGTYWKGGFRASRFHQLPSLPGEPVGPVKPAAKARKQAEHFKAYGASPFEILI